MNPPVREPHPHARRTGRTRSSRLPRTHKYRMVRIVVATLALVAIAGCEAPSLANVGERSGEWIGSITNGVTFMPQEPHPLMVMVGP